MRIFITRAVVVESQRSPKVASEKKRGGQSRRPRADHDAVVQIINHYPTNPSECKCRGDSPSPPVFRNTHDSGVRRPRSATPTIAQPELSTTGDPSLLISW